MRPPPAAHPRHPGRSRPAARRGSLATALLGRAAEWATEQGRDLTLNVTDDGRSAAVAFYEATGWQYTHTSQADWTTPEGRAVQLRHYVLPASRRLTDRSAPG